jgi:hypothetical protein
VGVYLLPEVPMKPSKELVFQSRSSGLSGVEGEEKLYELQYETKRSVLGGKGVGTFGADAHNKLQGCQMKKYPTGYLTNVFTLRWPNVCRPNDFLPKDVAPFQLSWL